jgi:hypothetical protein
MLLPRRRVRHASSAAVALAVALLFVVVAAVPAAAVRWRFEDLDGPGVPGGSGRSANEVSGAVATVEFNGLPHAFYHDESTGRLRHAWWTGRRWAFEDLDGNGVPGGAGRVPHDVGEHVTATVWNREPHVFYRDATNERLRHAWWNGSRWLFENLDGPGVPGGAGRTANGVADDNTVRVYAGLPHVFYRDTTAGRLRHAWWSGSRWLFENLDGPGVPGGNGRTADAVGAGVEIVVDRTALDVYHLATTDNRLRRAGWTGTGWEFENLDGPRSVGGNGRTTHALGGSVAAVVWSNQTHLFYADLTAGRLRHGWNDGVGRFENLDGTGVTGGNGRRSATLGSSAATFLFAGTPHVVYHDDTNGRMRHGWWTGLRWLFEDLDGNGVPGGGGRSANDVGNDNAVLIWRGEPHVFHVDVSAGRLRHAWYG